jgi:signal transduction histidine kinase
MNDQSFPTTELWSLHVPGWRAKSIAGPKTADKHNVATLRGSIQHVVTGKPVRIAAASFVGLIGLGALLFRFLVPALAVQFLVTLLVPALVMVVFWSMARSRLLEREAATDAAIELESVANRAANAFVVGIAHELKAHRRECSLRAEALAVAVDYRHVNPELRVAVPDVIVEADPHLLRQILHTLVANALRHGGSRVAVWATEEGPWVRLTVSDDGPGLPDEIAAHLRGHSVDLVESTRSSRPAGTGLPVVRALCASMGCELTYRRDPTWTHFSLNLPLQSVDYGPILARVPLEAGVR